MKITQKSLDFGSKMIILPLHPLYQSGLTLYYGPQKGLLGSKLASVRSGCLVFGVLKVAKMMSKHRSGGQNHTPRVLISVKESLYGVKY